MKYKVISLFCVVLALMVSYAHPTRTFAQDEVRSAFAPLQDANGNSVGSIAFTQITGKVLIAVQVNGLPAGFHGFHIHAVGQCDATTEKPFSSAGPHHNPTAVAYVDQAGSLPVLLVGQDGTGMMTFTSDRFTVADLLDADGSAVVVHAGPDNYANIPERYGIAVDEETQGTGDAGPRIACGVIATPTAAATSPEVLAGMNALPLDLMPASVSRDERAEHGTLVITVPGLGGAQVQTQIESGAGGVIGHVTREGETLVFTFTEITYNVAPIALPNGLTIGAQTIRLDPTQPNTLRVDLTTGQLSRDLHWIMEGTDVLYNGQPTIALGDTARAEIVSLTQVGDNLYDVHLVTHWGTNVQLDNWSIGGTTLPSGEIESHAEFDGTYHLDFNQ